AGRRRRTGSTGGIEGAEGLARAAERLAGRAGGHADDGHDRGRDVLGHGDDRTGGNERRGPEPRGSEAAGRTAAAAEARPAGPDGLRPLDEAAGDRRRAAAGTGLDGEERLARAD